VIVDAGEHVGEPDLGIDIVGYNTKRPHQGCGMKGRTPATAFVEGLPKPHPEKKEKSPPEKSQKQLAA
jgi:hypothetical protein